jgi:hypothetical protein
MHRAIVLLGLGASLLLLGFSAQSGLARHAASQATIVWSGSGTLQGTFSFDFDGGGQTSSGADVFWRQQTSVERKLEPQNGAQLVNLGVVNFDGLAPESLQGLAYSSSSINGNNDSSNQLVTGDVFAVRTSSGNLAKVKVVLYGYNLSLQWVTYKGYKLDIQKAGSGKGTVKSSPGGIDCGSKCTAYFLAGGNVGITVAPAEGSSFDGFDFSCSGTGSCSILMNNNRSLKVTFGVVQVKLTVTKSGNGTVTGSPAGIACVATCVADYPWGTSVTLTAAAASGTSFLGWGDACSGGDPTCTITLKAPASVSATFGALSVTKAALEVKWKQSRSEGRVIVGGSTSHDASLLVTLKPGSEASKAVLIRRKAVKAGGFNVSLPVPDRLRPGRYVLIVEPTLQGIALPAQKSTLKLAPPKEGVVATAYISTTRGGKPVKSVPKGTKKLYAYFKYATGGMSKLPLTVEWYGPKGTLVGATKKPRKPVVETFIAYGPGLFKGTWGCILRAGGVIVEDVFIRVS